MKPDKAIELFTSKAISYLESSEAFLKKEVPVFIEELLRYEAIEAVVILVVLVGLGIIFIKWSFYFKNKMKEEPYSLYDMGLTIMVIVSLVILLFVTMTTLKIIKINTAPRAYLIEYLRSDCPRRIK